MSLEAAAPCQTSKMLNSRWQNSFAKFVASSLRICLPKEQKQERQQTQIPELLQDHARTTITETKFPILYSQTQEEEEEEFFNGNQTRLATYYSIS
jgi:hypothetical protein